RGEVDGAPFLVRPRDPHRRELLPRRVEDDAAEVLERLAILAVRVARDLRRAELRGDEGERAVVRRVREVVERGEGLADDQERLVEEDAHGPLRRVLRALVDDDERAGKAEGEERPDVDRLHVLVATEDGRLRPALEMRVAAR